MPKQVAIVFTKGEKQSLQAFRKSVYELAKLFGPEWIQRFKKIEQECGADGSDDYLLKRVIEKSKEA